MRDRGLLTLCAFLAGACARPASPVTPPPTIAPPAQPPQRAPPAHEQAQQVPKEPSVRSDSEPSDSEPPANHPPDGDPRLLERLTISVPEPRALGETRFQAAREVFREVKRGLLDRSYVERKNASCAQ